MKRYFKVLIILLCLVIVAGVARAVVSAEESGPSQSPSLTALPEGESDVTEVVPEENSEEVAELLKEVLIIMAESETKGEAIDKIMTSNIRPDATYGEVSDLVDSFDEMSLFWDCKSCVIIDLSEGLNYGLDRNWLEWYTNTYFPELPEDCENIDIDEEVASEVVDIVVNADNKNEAILAVAKKVGVDVEKAEAIVDTIISTGDAYFGEDAWWTGFKEDIIANKNFWITVVLCILCGLAILGMIFVFVAKVVPILNKSNFGMNEMFKLSSGMQEANSQTLGKIEELAARVAEKDEAYNKLLAEKEEHIEKLVERIAEMKAAAEKERRSMVLAESYNLQILKLICSRTALPLADKAAIDLWYTKAMESLKSELSVEDIKKIENVAATLEVSDGKAV